MKQFIVGLHAAFSDVAMTIQDMVAEGDRLVGRWVMRGTNTGSFNGMPPTGRPVTLSGFDLLRVEGDRFAEVWHVEDTLRVDVDTVTGGRGRAEPRRPLRLGPGAHGSV